MSDTTPPPETGDDLTSEALRRAARWVDAPGNPRTYPARSRAAVEADLARSSAERASLDTMIETSGQGDALFVPELEAISTGSGAGCSSITWVEGRICVLERADVLVLFGLPATLDGEPSVVRARWDVVERICGARCWQVVRDLALPRVVTRRWPSADELHAIADLALPDRPG